ncbi:MAG TPA: alpha/beta hydrolase [Falsiroseomonas sp.]|jgi:pimeloyl-ACP methyl ester carboxylesterase|nr:alpha/beta hydrolase [Falsiroseomonas sp.]
MLLLHGYPLSGALFARVRDGLAARHRVVTLDHRGYGFSGTPGVPDNIEVYGRDVLAVMQRIGLERATIAGMSMGGPITFEMYRQAPQRFTGMVLIDTVAAPANPAEAGLWQGVAEMVRQNRVEAILPVLTKEMLTGDTRMNQPALVQYLQGVMKEAKRDAALGGAIALATRPDYTGLLGQIRVPTLVFVGREDSVYPVEIAQRMHQQIQGSTLEVIPDAAHAAIFEKPEPSVQAILGWANAAQGARTGSSR